MPSPISITRTGTGWTIDVTSLVLSTNLGYKDFYVKVSGVVSPLSNYTKTNSTLVTYSGTSLAASTPVVIYRDSNRLVDDLVYGEINSAAALNSRTTQVELVLEDLRQMIVP